MLLVTCRAEVEMLSKKNRNSVLFEVEFVPDSQKSPHITHYLPIIIFLPTK